MLYDNTDNISSLPNFHILVNKQFVLSSKTKKFKSGIVGYDFISAFGGYSIIKNEHPLVYKNILKVIKTFIIQDSEILALGGNESVITQRLKKEFLNLKWHVEVIAHKLNHFEVKQGKAIIEAHTHILVTCKS